MTDEITTRELVLDAIALDDAARKDFERFKKRQRSAPQVLYKRNDDALIAPAASDPNGDALEQRMRQFTSEIVEALAEEAGAAVGKLERQVIDEIAKLRGEVAKLRVNLAARSANVTPMRGRNVA